MAFANSVVDQAFRRAVGVCQNCGHWIRRDMRGVESDYGWEAHHIQAGGPDTRDNCRILCTPCHKSTASYGG